MPFSNDCMLRDNLLCEVVRKNFLGGNFSEDGIVKSEFYAGGAFHG